MTEAERSVWASYPRAMRSHALKILDNPEPVQVVDENHWDVVSLKTPSRRVRVYRRDDEIRCKSDKRIKAGEAVGGHYNQDRPCAHIVAVMVTEGMIERPDTSGEVWTKGDDGRQQGVEAEAWRRVPVRVPELMAKLLHQGLPVIAPEPPQASGRPRAPLFTLAYQSVMRCFERGGLYAAQGRMATPTHRQHTPRALSVAAISRFLAAKTGLEARDPEARARVDPDEVLQKLLALSTWPARPYESVFHPDGTGLTEQRFSSYFDERYSKDVRKQKAKREARRKKGQDTASAPGARKAVKPRLHHWTYTEILWTYRYTLVAALYAQQGPFSEAQWAIPLMDRARLMLKPKEFGADKAYNAYYLDAYLAAHKIESQIKVKENANPGRSSARKKAYKRRVERAQLDPEGFAARADRRNNAETGNHAFKAIVGDQIYSKDARAQRNEILCMALAYNLTRLVYLEVERGIEVDFAEGARHLAAAKWERLEDLHARYRAELPKRMQAEGKRPEWA
ncbi:MAG: hypothetical protein LC623_01680 [Halobacteriales archaeon]|nr:hypothetical protein [Halobacteriales archaeon]